MKGPKDSAPWFSFLKKGFGHLVPIDLRKGRIQQVRVKARLKLRCSVAHLRLEAVGEPILGGRLCRPPLLPDLPACRS